MTHDRSFLFWRRTDRLSSIDGIGSTSWRRDTVAIAVTDSDFERTRRRSPPRRSARIPPTRRRGGTGRGLATAAPVCQWISGALTPRPAKGDESYHTPRSGAPSDGRRER